MKNGPLEENHFFMFIYLFTCIYLFQNKALLSDQTGPELEFKMILLLQSATK